MTLDRTKAAIWVAVILMISSVLVFRSERKEPIKLPPPPVAEVVVPAPPVVVPAPAVVPSAPAVTAPVTKARPRHRVAPPEPVVKSKPSVKTKCGECGPKPAAKRKRLRNCHLLPPEAYSNPEFLVISAARQRGIDENGIMLLKACLKQHAEGGR